MVAVSSMMNSVSHPVFEIVRTSAGAVSIRNKVVNEIMHNPVGPWIEANELYIDQSRLRERLVTGSLADELVIFDVGLGAAANALAVLHCVSEFEPSQRRPVKLISFERDLDLLQFALAHASEFEHFQKFIPAIQSLLKEGKWVSDGIIWQLRAGDFLKTLPVETERPHLIYFDPYSPQVNRDMWTSALFRVLRSHSRELVEGGTVLFTYSQATPIRTAMLLAGFVVGYGRPTGLKEETTQAATDLSLLAEPLGGRWLKRWQASHASLPFDCTDQDRAEVQKQILSRAQFHLVQN